MEKVHIENEDFHRELLPIMLDAMTAENLQDYLDFHEKDPVKWEKEIELLKNEIKSRTK